MAQLSRPPLRASGATGPMMGVRPDAWTAAATNVVNATDADANVLAVLGFELDPNFQFARQLWIPSHSTLHVWIPFHGPTFKPAPRLVLTSETLLLDEHASGTEHVLSREPGLMIGERDKYDNIVALLSARDDTETMVIAARRSIDSTNRQVRGNNATVIDITPDHLPPCPQTLGEFDTLVLGEETGTLDLAQLQNIRQWVSAGKTLWINAPDVDDDQLQMLLGDAWTARTIDRTELQDFSILGRHSPVIVHTDDPVDLVRMVPGKNMTVLERVNGYPAAMKFPLGAGRVFITTLAPAGWATSPNKPSSALNSLSQEMFPPEVNVPTLFATLDKHLVALAPAQVGYKIVSRSMVMTVLAGFCLAFLIAGLFLMRTGKMEWFAVAGVGLAVLASAALLAEASIAHQAVPLTVASAGVTQVFPHQQSALQQADLAVYNPGGAAGPVETRTGGMFWPTTGIPKGGLIRLVFMDRDRWQWQDLSIGAGAMLRGDFTASTDLAPPVRADVRLGDPTAEARLESGKLGSFEDVLLAGPNGAMLVHPGQAGSLSASDADLVRNDQYTAGSVLSDIQRQHQETYRQLFAGASPITEPTLLGFADGSLADVTTPQEPQRRATNLVSVPIEFAVPTAGSAVTIPSAFIPFEITRIQGFSVGMFPYSTTLHSWIPNLVGPMSTQQVLQFTLPPALLPMKLTDVTFDMTLRAPGRDVTLFKLAGEQPITLTTAHGPLGVVEAKMTGADCPAVDRAGRIMLGFTVTADNDPKHTWEVSDARLTVTGEKLPRTTEDAPAIRVSSSPTHSTVEAAP
jgi:hypothetical protein